MFETVKFGESQIIYKKGFVLDGIFMVKSGSVSLLIDEGAGAVIFKQIKPGGYLELSRSVGQLPAFYTATANEVTELLYVPLQYIDVYVSTNPVKTIEMLTLLSDELSDLNEKLLNQGSKEKYYSKDKAVNISKTDKRVEIQSDRMYYKVLPQNHYQYLFDKDVECPVCELKFKVNQIRFSKIELERTTPDFRRIYKDIDELWYQLWRCPHCHYTNFGSDFFKINNIVRNELRLSLPRYKLNHELMLVKDNIQQVFADIYQMNAILDVVTKSSFTKARLWQMYAWLLEDVNDEETARQAREILLLYLEDGWYNNTSTIEPDDEVKLAMKLAILSREFGNIKNARSYILEATRVKDANKQIRQMAQDLLFEIKNS